MPKDQSIFGLRFGSNAELQPTREELRTFLAGPKKAGSREARGSDLASYEAMLARIDAFERARETDSTRLDIRERMFYSVLILSSFFNQALKTAVTQYQYHLHALLLLDFRKPTAFIRSAEEEIARLNPKKNDDAAKRARLQTMVDERRRTLAMLAKRWDDRAAELSNIAKYIRDNLVKIKKLCEGSIVVLVDLQVAGREANRLVEDIKESFKEKLRDSLHYGKLTRDQLEAAKKDVAILSEEMSSLLREDVFSLTTLLEAIHDHAGRIAGEIDGIASRIAEANHTDTDSLDTFFEEIGQSLISLMSMFRFELKSRPLSTETAHEDVLLEKRKELLDRLFGLLRTERRGRSDRRSGEDRRKFKDPGYTGPERRKGPRRSGKSRR